MLSLAGERKDEFVGRVAAIQRLCKHILRLGGRAHLSIGVEQRSASWVSIRIFWSTLRSAA